MQTGLMEFHRSKKLAAPLLALLACKLLTGSAFAGTRGTWVSDLTGLPIVAPIVDYTADLPFQGTASASLTGLDFGLNVGHLEFSTGLITPASPTPVSW